jgi:hypothetical protein
MGNVRMGSRRRFVACLLGVFWSVVWPGQAHLAIHRGAAA